MPLHVRNVNADLHTQPGASRPSAQGAAPATGGTDAMSDRALAERLRPIVMDILRRELEELKRRTG